MGHELALPYELLRIIYLFSPLLGGSVFHGLCLRFKWFAFLARPIDCGTKFRGRRLFGDNKTVRGLIVPGVGTGLALALQSQLMHALPALRPLGYFDYSSVPPMLLGFSLGVAATLSELPNSFLKRQLDIPSGQSAKGISGMVFYFIDQVDLLVGVWLVLAVVTQVTPERLLLSVILMLIVHPCLTLIGYLLGLRKTLR